MEQDVETGYKTKCSGCLCSSSDRRLFYLNSTPQANQIFQLIMKDFAGDRFVQSLPEMEHQVCWECLALMKRFHKFKWQVHSAQEHLGVLALGKPEQNTDYKFMPQSLSNLKIETKYEFNYILIDSAIQEEGSSSIDICNIKRENYNTAEVVRNVKVSEIQDKFLKDPLITTEQNKLKIEEKYLEIEIKREHIEEPIADAQFNITPSLETIIPKEIQEPTTVIIEVPKFIKNEITTPNTKRKYPTPNRKRTNTTQRQDNEKKVAVKKPITTEKKKKVAESKESDQLVEDRKKNIPKRRYKKTKPGQLNEDKCNDEDDDIICKILNRTEINKFRDKKRELVVFKGATFKCEKCIEKFNSQEGLDEHNKKHDETRGAHVCEVCEQRFPDINSRNKHSEEHFKVYECKICSYQNLERVRISDHIHRIHEISTFKCGTCDAVFKTFRDKRQHCLKEHYKRPTCQECGKTFLNTTSLHSHVAGTHRGERLECTICKKKVKGASMKSHMKLHDPTPEETVYCVDCGTTYKNKQCYAVHLRTSLKHNTIEQLGYKCKYCNKYCTSSMNLRDHIEIEHVGGDFTCETCKKVFKNKRVLWRHVRCVHLRIMPNVKLRICEICGKSFKTRIDLVHHINSHLGHRPYVCQDCGDTFSYAAALYTHRRLIHKVKKKSEMNNADGQ